MSKGGELKEAQELASRLTQRITIEQPATTADGQGGQSISWQTLATVWAEVLPQRSGGDERVMGEQLQAKVTHRVTIRYRDDVLPKHRISHAGKHYNIRSIRNVQSANVLLEIEAEEGVAQ